MGFAFAVKLVDDLWSAHRVEVGLGFMRDGARDQSLSAAGRTIEQHALGGADAEPLEDLGIAQRQFDHFTDTLELRFQSADVLVRGGARGPFLQLLRPADHSLGGGIDQYRAFRRGALHPEVRRPPAEERGADAGSRLYRQAVEQIADIIHVALGRPDVGRGQHDAVGRTATGLAHHDELVEPGSGVFAHQPVDLEARLPTEFLVGGHRLADGRALAGNFHHVPDGELQFLEVFRTHAGDSPPDILAQRLGDFELDRRDFPARFSRLLRLHRIHLISTTPLLQVMCVFSLVVPAGSSTSLRYFLSPRAAVMVRTSSSTVIFTSSALTPGISARTSTWSSSSKMSTTGSRTSCTTVRPDSRSLRMLPKGSTLGRSPPRPTLTVNP